MEWVSIRFCLASPSISSVELTTELSSGTSASTGPWPFSSIIKSLFRMCSRTINSNSEALVRKNRASWRYAWMQMCNTLYLRLTSVIASSVNSWFGTDGNDGDCWTLTDFWLTDKKLAADGFGSFGVCTTLLLVSVVWPESGNGNSSMISTASVIVPASWWGFRISSSRRSIFDCLDASWFLSCSVIMQSVRYDLLQFKDLLAQLICHRLCSFFHSFSLFFEFATLVFQQLHQLVVLRQLDGIVNLFDSIP